MLHQFETFDKVPLEPRDIGGELLDILSRGLYSDARDAIREYAQNSIDAKATTIWVRVDGSTVVINDDGEGMDWEQIRRARRLGMSDKSTRDNVGFRGIGIYSAFGMCDAMEISSRPKGGAERYTVRFDFGAMREILEHDREGGKRAEVALGDLLYEHVAFSRNEHDFGLGDEHGTTVTLDGIDQEYRAQLADDDSLRSYLLNTLPIAFPEREYGQKVNHWLAKEMKQSTVRLSLKVGIEPEAWVEPYVVHELDKPVFDWVKNQGKTLAGIWYARSPHRNRLGSRSRDDDSDGAGGFLLKSKGFTLGNRLSLKSLWPRLGGGALYHHFTGEVHLMDSANVFPNAARSWLEPSAAQQTLERCLADYFDQLNRRADLAREINLATSKVPGLRKTLDDIQRMFESEDTDPYELYRKCKNHSDLLADTERRALRLTRGRKATRPSNPAEAASLEQLKTELKELITTTEGLSRRAMRLTENNRRRRQGGPQKRPQIAVLERALLNLTAMQDARPDPDVSRAVTALQGAVQAQSIGRATPILDGLKASGIPLSEGVEDSRQELRGALGWAPTGPVSLRELLEDLGFVVDSDPERTLLVKACDQGLLEASGGRGQKYETALNTIADEMVHDINDRC